MKIDIPSELTLRAAKHAALSDPARLWMIDLLTLGDLSPSEISTALNLPQNLISHHIGVLEAAEMVTRSRSHGDHRRSYIHLTGNALTGLVPGTVEKARRVLFVCSANSARSQLATALWRRVSDVPVASAGTHPAERIDLGALDVAARHNLTLPLVPPQAFTDVAVDSDLIITVCDDAHEELRAIDSLHWSIPDPVQEGSEEAFDSAFRELERRVADLVAHIVSS